MKFNKNELADFARYYGFHFDICDSKTLVNDFLMDAKRGLAGKSSYMPMIPAYLKPPSSVPAGKKVLALDAGGTNLRAACVHFDGEGKAVIEGLVKVPMPGSKGRLNADEFYNAIAGVCAPLLEAHPGLSGMGFCFSYPMEITKESDGIPLAFSKEIDAPEVTGKPVGAGLKAALKRRGVPTPDHIVLLNDTVATLLTGAAQIPALRPSKLEAVPAKCCPPAPGPVVGLILGTGFNIAYPEICIPKLGGVGQTPQIIVTESGNFHFRYQGLLDKQFDAQTKSPGAYTAEKAMAGAYLGGLTMCVFKKAVDDGLLSFRKQDEFLAMENLQTRDLNAFLHAPLSGEGLGALFDVDETDAIAAAVYLAGIITERAGLLCAALTAGTVITMNAAHPLAPVRIAVEGTTYLVYHFIRESFEARLRSILASYDIYDYLVTPVDQASLIGAAVAALG
ncbi:MAG: hexokinase [Spirochaetaceae bacterium]|jgi:hexokinase|nr:hexokinase [Spirochaetaceae bacterium]